MNSAIRLVVATLRPSRVASTRRSRSGPGKANSSLGRFATSWALTVDICLFAVVGVIAWLSRLCFVERFSYGLVGLDQIGQAHSGVGGAGGWQVDHRSVPLLLQVRQAVATVELTGFASCSEYGVDRRTIQQAGDVGRNDIGDRSIGGAVDVAFLDDIP